MKINYRIVNTVLAVAAVAMAVICTMSILGPVRFDAERQRREAVVHRHLDQVMAAEQRYLAAHGTYTASVDTLVKAGLLPDSLRLVPFSTQPKTITINTSVDVLESGRTKPLVECSAPYADFLDGLSRNEIDNLVSQASAEGRFPGVKVGNIDN